MLLVFQGGSSASAATTSSAAGVKSGAEARCTKAWARFAVYASLTTCSTPPTHQLIEHIFSIGHPSVAKRARKNGHQPPQHQHSAESCGEKDTPLL